MSGTGLMHKRGSFMKESKHLRVSELINSMCFCTIEIYDTVTTNHICTLLEHENEKASVKCTIKAIITNFERCYSLTLTACPYTHASCCRLALFITKTHLYNFYPLKPQFYVVKLVFTGVYIIFHISAQKH